MVKKIFHCEICQKIGPIHICRKCTGQFCTNCIDKVHEGITYQNELPLHNSQISYVDYCAYKCMGSNSPKYCFDCGENYMNMRRCLCCRMVFCSCCQKKNLINVKKIEYDDLNVCRLFCSKSCFEIYMEQPNNQWCICEDCGNEYYDISYKKQCDKCIFKSNYEKDVLFNENRIKLQEKMTSYLEKISPEEKKEFLEKIYPKVIQLSLQYPNITQNKVTLDAWLKNKDVGNNICYNLWDNIIDDYLQKIEL